MVKCENCRKEVKEVKEIELGSPQCWIDVCDNCYESFKFAGEII